MQFLTDTRIDFLRFRRFWIAVSFVVMAAGMVLVVFLGKLNLGIDFAGGTQLIVAVRGATTEELRDALRGAGLEAQVQRFGGDSGQFLMSLTATGGALDDAGNRAIRALEERLGGAVGGLDLNRVGADRVATFLIVRDPEHRVAAGASPEEVRAHYEVMAKTVLRTRNENGLVRSWEELSASGVAPSVVSALREEATLGPLSVIGKESVGPQIGSELRHKAFLAVALSLVGMMVYIALRFELRFGIGAVAASVHDVLVTLGLYAAAGLEFNLSTVAAFLTLVGYSVNDTVVVFDRVRENLRANRRDSLEAVINLSLNQTLSRTLLTSGTTLIAAATLLALAGEVLRGFSFVLTVGVVVGTYSSIYIASPFVLLWESWFGGRSKRARRQEEGVGPAPSGRGHSGRRR